MLWLACLLLPACGSSPRFFLDAYSNEVGAEASAASGDSDALSVRDSGRADASVPPPDVPQADTRGTCLAPEAPAYASLDYELPITAGTVVTYTCDRGYRPTTDGSTTITRTCGADGRWDGQAIECAPVNCGQPPSIEHGAVDVTATTYLAKAKYTCVTDYTVSGQDTVTCQATGAWSPAPICARQQYNLTVTKTGVGTVTDKSVGIDCGAVCQVTLDKGTTINLSATAGADHTFIQWGTRSCPGQGTCTFSLSVNTTISATFSPPPNIMFVTSTTQTGDLGGLAGADALCNQRAQAVIPRLPGTYKAWLSTPTDSAADRMGNASGWIRPDGKPIFNFITDLMDSKMAYPPRLDEFGRDQGHSKVMTSTNASGVGWALPEDNCNEFTSTDPHFSHLPGGYASASGSLFTQNVELSCTVEQRIYCLGIDRAAMVLPPTPVAGRYAFATSGSWSPAGGIASADALCQKDAAQARLPGTYKALLATTTASAASRFDTSGLPWIRTDGIPITPTAADFFTTSFFDVPPNMSADKTQYFSMAHFYSGASSMTALGTSATTCSDWQATTGDSTIGLLGDTSTSDFFAATSYACINGSRIVCMQE